MLNFRKPQKVKTSEGKKNANFKICINQNMTLFFLIISILVASPVKIYNTDVIFQTRISVDEVQLM